MTIPQRLIRKIENETLLSATTFDLPDMDEALDGREEEEFDSEWMRVFNAFKD